MNKQKETKKQRTRVTSREQLQIWQVLVQLYKKITLNLNGLYTGMRKTGAIRLDF